MRLPSYRLGVILAFILQVGLLGWLVADRALLIANGKEIRLDVVPVDPADLFRGDYVTLTYTISRIASTRVDGDNDFAWQDPIYVTIVQDGTDDSAGGWKATAISHEPPASGVYLKGTVRDTSTSGPCTGVSECTVYSVDYNLEQWFVPEGTGRDLEQLRNDQKISVDVAVAKNGRAALKRLLVDGQVKYVEGLY
jgi:uncharacterized membrane-anchored protein